VVAVYFLIFQVNFLQLNLIKENPLRSWQSIFVVGLPAIMTNLIVPFSASAITWLVAQHGPEVVAAFAVATRIEQFALVPVIALASIMGPFIGQNYGAKEYKRIQEAIFKAAQFSLFFMVAVWAIFFITSDHLGRLFSDDPTLNNVISDYLIIICPSYVFLSIFMCINASFNGL